MINLAAVSDVMGKISAIVAEAAAQKFWKIILSSLRAQKFPVQLALAAEIVNSAAVKKENLK